MRYPANVNPLLSARQVSTLFEAGYPKLRPGYLVWLASFEYDLARTTILVVKCTAYVAAGAHVYACPVDGCPYTDELYFGLCLHVAVHGVMLEPRRLGCPGAGVGRESILRLENGVTVRAFCDFAGAHFYHWERETEAGTVYHVTLDPAARPFGAARVPDACFSLEHAVGSDGYVRVDGGEVCAAMGGLPDGQISVIAEKMLAGVVGEEEYRAFYAQLLELVC